MVGDSINKHKQRHGLKLKLTADVTAWDYHGERQCVDLMKLREAIDLWRLLVMVKPKVMKATIRRLECWGSPVKHTQYKDELQALVRGVPVDFRVVLEHSALKTLDMDTQLAGCFFHELDQTSPTDKAFLLALMELESMLLNKHSLEECNLILGTPVDAIVSINSSESRGATETESEQFFNNVQRFVKRLHRHEQQRAEKTAAFDGKHMGLRVEQCKLHLQSLCITPRTQRCVQSIMASGIPVKCSSVTIHPGHIVSHRSTVQAFVDAVATAKLNITTQTAMCPDLLDRQGQDHTQLIHMVVEVLASVDQLNMACFSGLFKLYQSRHNREAIWRGLFDVVLSKQSPIKDLSLAYGIRLTAEDAELITKSASTWRIWNPDKKLRLQRLHIGLFDSDPAAVLALLAAFDDLEHLWIEDEDSITRRQLPHEILVCALRFPSLRRLAIENLAVESMDVVDSSITGVNHPTKPILEELELDNMTLQDTESLRRFISKLAPNPSAPHALAGSLRRLVVDQKNRTFADGTLFDPEMAEQLDGVLFENTVLKYVKFRVDRTDQSMHKRRQHFLLHNGRHVRASQRDRPGTPPSFLECDS